MKTVSRRVWFTSRNPTGGPLGGGLVRGGRVEFLRGVRSPRWTAFTGWEQLPTPTRTPFLKTFFRRPRGPAARYPRPAVCACVNFPANQARSSKNSGDAPACDAPHLQ